MSACTPRKLAFHPLLHGHCKGSIEFCASAWIISWFTTIFTGQKLYSRFQHNVTMIVTSFMRGNLLPFALASDHSSINPLMKKRELRIENGFSGLTPTLPITTVSLGATVSTVDWPVSVTHQGTSRTCVNRFHREVLSECCVSCRRSKQTDRI